MEERVVNGSQDVANLTQQTAAANAALMRGDIDRYLALTEHAHDYTLMSPFGGEPTHGFDLSRRVEMGRFFSSGTFDQEVVATYATEDLAVLVTIERVCGEVGGLPKQDWSLRVTQVFRHEANAWQLVHRHADPLANGISLKLAAVLALGVADDRPSIE
ncbi:YybH family protein [Chamaesiphon minutus]|uniref:Ketosteroid isomerase-like enzyme n=1 Tax=Chamaesiphon minutus (strain ATCC 27169 / PCC 6605) TaxID=1173020 RepID=K9UDX1_CHAP6|nr:nuclear transport factor 2 family protein [Chamaesiphon minutus]AFY93297.1 ketosteroid isomerase-like enzyme [Chamaesiphon minutus PCC 6605]